MVLQGDFAGAEESAARAVTCFRRCGPNSKLATATALYNLAGICKRQVGALVAFQRHFICIYIHIYVYMFM